MKKPFKTEVMHEQKYLPSKGNTRYEEKTEQPPKVSHSVVPQEFLDVAGSTWKKELYSNIIIIQNQ